MIQWYRDLKEIPGRDGDYGVSGWDYEGFKALFQKHGWPDGFDGDAFEADLARFKAHDIATRRADDPMEAVEHLTRWEGLNKRHLKSATERMFAATTPDELWIAKFELRKAQQSQRRNRRLLRIAIEDLERLCPRYECQNPLIILQLEVKSLRMELEFTVADTYALARRRVRKVTALSRAYKEAAAEVAKSEIPENYDATVRVRVWDVQIPFFDENLECQDACDCQLRDIEALKKWLHRVPNDAPEARDKIKLELQTIYEHHRDEQWHSRRYLRWQFREWLDPQRPWGTCRIAK